MSEFTATVKLAEAERELKYRRWLYPRLIAEGRMTDGTAASRIAVLEAIADDYRAQSQSERLV